MKRPPGAICEWPPMKRCFTESEAKHLAKQQHQRAYPCTHGDHWHLASYSSSGHNKRKRVAR